MQLARVCGEQLASAEVLIANVAAVHFVRTLMSGETIAGVESSLAYFALVLANYGRIRFDVVNIALFDCLVSAPHVSLESRRTETV